MAKKNEIKRLERFAKSLLLDKEIPPDVMDRVRGLLNDKNLDKEYRYREIINVVQKLPNKKTIHGDEIELRDLGGRGQARTEQDKKPRETKPLLGPTETALYVDALLAKHKSSKLFKKRYLVHKNNRFGIGLRKRIVPTRHCRQAIERIADMHERVIYRLTDILDDILFDPEAQDPVIYNYLKVFYSWMTNVPLLKLPYDKIVWMERKDFDKEFKSYVTHFFSFYKLGTTVREGIMIEIEKRLRLHGTYTHDFTEKGNFLKEKEVTRIMMAARFFLPGALDETGPAAKDVFGNGSVRNLPEFLFAVSETLIFQRAFQVEELIDYYRIVPTPIRHDDWDCHPELLEKAGKNRQKKLEAEIRALQEKMAPYDTIVFLLSAKEGGELMLHRAMREYWRIVHNKDWQPKQVFNTHYMLFVYSVCAYYMDAVVPLINGVPALYRDFGREEMEGAIFSPSYFESELGTLAKVHRSFKSMYGSKSVPRVARETVKESLMSVPDKEEPSTLLILKAGDAFFRIGRELQRVLDNHRLWKFNRSVSRIPGDKRSFLDRLGDSTSDQKEERCIPYFDCTLVNVSGGGALARDMYGKRVIEDSTMEGIFISAAALSLQSASALMNRELELYLQGRNELARQIENLTTKIS